MKYLYFLDICKCGCNTIIYGNKSYVYNHHFIGKRLGNDNPATRLEVRKRISNTLMGNIPWNKGKFGCVSEKGKENISKANKGRSPPNKGTGTPSFAPYCEKWTESLREKIRNNYNRKCYNCGKDEKNNISKTNKIRRLSVHHIDMDKEQGCNGKQWKLVPLCMFCHAKSHKIIIKGEEL